MINNNQLEKNNFQNLIENDDIDRVEDRLNIIDVFLETEEHVTLEEMMRLLLTAREVEHAPAQAELAPSD